MAISSLLLLAVIIVAVIFVVFFLYSSVLIVGGKEINVLERRWFGKENAQRPGLRHEQ